MLRRPRALTLPKLSLARLALPCLVALAALGAVASPLPALGAPASIPLEQGEWVADPATGKSLYHVNGALADCVFVSDAANGELYWFERGEFVREHAFFDAASQEWYWADADGTIACDKDVFIPKDESDRTKGGKWVRVDADYALVKGEDLRYGGWYWFDPVTGEMAKGFVFVPSKGGKWVFYDYITGQMAHGERYIDGSFGDEPGWMYFDDVTGAVHYGWKDLPGTNGGTGKTVYYDGVTGRMVYGWRNVDGMTCLFDPHTGEAVIRQSVVWKGTEKYSSGRQGNDWQCLVIHTTQIPTLEGVDEVFADADGRAASAHYAVCGTEVHQYVRLEDTAWAVGNWNWNTRTVSIEHVGTSDVPPTYETLDTSAKLMASLAHSKGWTSLVMGRNVDVHRSFYEDTECPFGLDVDWLVNRANHYLSLGAAR